MRWKCRDKNEAVLSLTPLPENGSSFTINTAISNSDRALFRENITIGGGYTGCLDHLIINQQPIFLLSPIEDVNIDTCGPRPPSETIRAFEGGAWLLGAASYIELSLQQFSSSDFEIQFSFRTFDASEILLFYPSLTVHQYLLIYLFEGKVAVDYNLSPLDVIHLETNISYNSGLWYELSLRINGSNFSMTVNSTETLLDSSSSVVDTVFAPRGVLFLGGISANYSDIDSLFSSSSVAGCMSNLTLNGLLVSLQTSVSNRVDFSGCPEVVSPGVRFMGTGRAEFGVPGQQFHNITFAFRTTQLAALLFDFGEFSVSIFHTTLRLSVSNSFVLESELGLSDNIRHSGSILLSSSPNSSMCDSSYSSI